MIISAVSTILYCIILPIYITLYCIILAIENGDFLFFLRFSEDGILNPLFIIGIIELILIGNCVRFIFSRLLQRLHNRRK